ITPPVPMVAIPPLEEEGKLPQSYWLGAPGEFQFESRVELPKGYTPDLPPKRDLLQEFAEYHSTYVLEDGVLVARYRILIKNAEVSGASVAAYKAFADKLHEDREQFILMASDRPQTPQQAMAALRQRIWNLPDSQNPEALQAEQRSREALDRRSIEDAV